MHEDKSVKPVLEVHNVAVKVNEQLALHPISFSIARGSKLAIAGETGSGKSSLLKAMAGLQNLESGTVYCNGERVPEAWEKLIPGHPSIAYLSQHFELRNNYRVGDLLSYFEKISSSAAAEIYSLCQVDHLLQRRTDQLSGGEKQRIAMARLLVGAPSIFLLDEPFSNLDPIHKQTMKQVLQQLGKKLEITWVLVSHDPIDLLSWADQLILLRDGKQEQKGEPLQVFQEPVSEYAAALLGTYSAIPASLWSRLNERNQSRRQWLRPASLYMTKPANAVVLARVMDTSFIGYGYLTAVECDDGTELTVLAAEKLSPDTAVGIKLR